MVKSSFCDYNSTYDEDELIAAVISHFITVTHLMQSDTRGVVVVFSSSSSKDKGRKASSSQINNLNPF